MLYTSTGSVKSGCFSIKGNYNPNYREPDGRSMSKDIFRTYVENRSFIQNILHESSQVIDDYPLDEFYIVFYSAMKIHKDNIDLQIKINPMISTSIK
jgi:hypothetical protein